MYGSLVKRIVLTLVVVGLSAMSFARQEPGTVALYPRLGVNLSKLTGDIIIDEATGLSSNPKYKFGCVLGLEVQYQFSPTFGIISGLLYSLEGSKYSDTTMETETERWVVKDMSSDLHYLKLPLLLSMYIGRSSFQLKAGVQFGWLVKGKTSNTNEYYNNDGDGWVFDESRSGRVESTSTSLFERFDLSIPIGVSYEYKHFVFEGRYNVGLRRVYKYVGSSVRNSNIIFTLGYCLNL